MSTHAIVAQYDKYYHHLNCFKLNLHFLISKLDINSAEIAYYELLSLKLSNLTGFSQYLVVLK